MYVAGDVVLFRSTSIISRIIQWGTRDKGESPTVVNHVGIMVNSTDIVESRTRTIRHTFNRPAKNCWVYRRKGLSAMQQVNLKNHAVEYVGRKYGWLKIVAHALDFLLGGRYVVRRLCAMDKYPICSWLVARCYEKIGIGFGVASQQATPDDIWDFITGAPDEWIEVK